MQIQTQNIDINICMHVYRNIFTHTHFSCIHILYAYGSTQWYLIRICPHLLYIYHLSFFNPTLPPVDRGIYMSRPYQFTVFASVKLKLHRTRIEKASRICGLAKRRKTREGRDSQRWEVGSYSWCAHAHFFYHKYQILWGAQRHKLPCSYIGPCFFNKQNDEGWTTWC